MVLKPDRKLSRQPNNLPDRPSQPVYQQQVVLGIAGQIAGTCATISFALAGIVALACAYSFGRLGATYPTAGGPVEFLVRGFGDGTFAGGFNILLWIGYIFALALYARAFGAYGTELLHVENTLLWRHILASGVIVLFTMINFLGAEAVGKSEFTIVAIKVAILLLFIGVGAAFVKPVAMKPDSEPASILYGAGIVFLAYEGFGLITNAGADMKHVHKNLPRALLLSVIITMVIYIGVVLVVLGNLPVEKVVEAKEYALAAAAEPFLGKTGFTIVAIAAVFSTASAINATLYGGANVSYIISRYGSLPPIFARKVWDRAREGLFITAGLVLVIANLIDLSGIAMLGSAAFLIVYGAVNAAHLRLRKETNGNAFVIWFGLLGCIATFIVLTIYEIGHSLQTLIILAIIVALCFAGEATYRHFLRRIISARGEEEREHDEEAQDS